MGRFGVSSRRRETSCGLLESVIKSQLLCQDSRSRTVDMTAKSPPTCWKISRRARSDRRIPNTGPPVFRFIIASIPESNQNKLEKERRGAPQSHTSDLETLGKLFFLFTIFLGSGSCRSQSFRDKVIGNVSKWKLFF